MNWLWFHNLLYSSIVTHTRFIDSSYVSLFTYQIYQILSNVGISEKNQITTFALGILMFSGLSFVARDVIHSGVNSFED